MRAAVYSKYGPPEVLSLKEVEKPIPGDNEVLIKVHATTVTAVDSIFRSGSSFFARLATGLLKPKKAILGTDFAGEIETVGNSVKSFKRGDHVFGDSLKGTHAEYISLPEDAALVVLPFEVTSDEAAAIPEGGLTALVFLRDSGRIRCGQKVLINGASGSVGSAAVQLAKHFGAEVTGVCSSSSTQLVKSIGADRVIDYTKEDFTRSGDTYDIIFDTVGKLRYSRCKASLNKNGRFLETVIALPILLQMFWTSRISSRKAIIAFTGMRPDKEKRKDLKFLKDLIKAGRLKPVIDRSYHLDEITDAHRYVDTGHKKGNVLVRMTSNPEESHESAGS
jgi:NADPH:quinone reductase-like Zn-dependent oxidoreductase